MKNRYEQVMDRVWVTDDMRGRVLETIRRTELGTSRAGWRRWTAVAACLVLLLVGAVTLPCLWSLSSEPPVQTVSQWVECASVQELSETLGFPVDDLTELPFQVERTVYTACMGELAQIDYEGEGQSASFRKAAGDADISGDFTVYADTIEWSLSGTTVTLRGDEDGYSLALWQGEGYTYSLKLSCQLPQTEWEDLLRSNGVG